MRRFLQFCFLVSLSLLILASCRKGGVTVPTGGGVVEEPPPPPPPPPPIVEVDPPILTAEKRKVSENILGYYSALPVHYTETTQKYPLMIFFHGGGQYGNGDSDLVEVLAAGIPKLLNEKTFPPSFTVKGESFSFVVIAPQLKKFILPAEVDQLVKFSVDNYRVDTNRIYLVGFSLGAQQLCNYAGDYATKAAALVAMAGTPYMDSTLEIRCKAMVDAHLPVWHFHNVDDQAWPYAESVRFNDVLNSFVPIVPPKFTTFQVGQGKSNHDCWTRTMDPAYKEDSVNIYEWMLGFHK